MQLVKESLNHHFTKGGEDKLKDIGIGKREMIKKWCDAFIAKYKDDELISQYVINKDNTIDVFVPILLEDKDIKPYIKFRYIAELWTYENEFHAFIPYKDVKVDEWHTIG